MRAWGITLMALGAGLFIATLIGLSFAFFILPVFGSISVILAVVGRHLFALSADQTPLTWPWEVTPAGRLLIDRLMDCERKWVEKTSFVKVLLACLVIAGLFAFIIQWAGPFVGWQPQSDGYEYRIGGGSWQHVSSGQAASNMMVVVLVPAILFLIASTSVAIFFFITTINSGYRTFSRFQNPLNKSSPVDAAELAKGLPAASPDEVYKMAGDLNEAAQASTPEPAPSPRPVSPAATIRCCCPGCGRKLRVKPEMVGRNAKCPGCNQTFQIPRKVRE